MTTPFNSDICSAYIKKSHLRSPVWSRKCFDRFFPAGLLHCGNVPAAAINETEKGNGRRVV